MLKEQCHTNIYFDGVSSSQQNNSEQCRARVDLIRWNKSFLKCRISNAMGGTEDDVIWEEQLLHDTVSKSDDDNANFVLCDGSE